MNDRRQEDSFAHMHDRHCARYGMADMDQPQVTRTFSRTVTSWRLGALPSVAMCGQLRRSRGASQPRHWYRRQETRTESSENSSIDRLGDESDCSFERTTSLPKVTVTLRNAFSAQRGLLGEIKTSFRVPLIASRCIPWIRE